MACQTPVIAANAGSLPEIVGDSALLIDPQNTGQISQAVISLLKDQNLRRNLINKGSQSVMDFSWDKTAFQTAGLYRRLTGFKDYMSA